MIDDEKDNKLDALIKENKILKKALDCLDEYILILDAEGRHIFRSTESEETTKDWIGEDLPVKCYKEMSAIFDSSGFGVSMAEKKPIRNTPYTCLDEKGIVHYLLADEFPIFDENKIIGVSGIARDHTKIYEISKILFEMQQQLNYIKGRKSNGTRFSFSDIIGESSAMKRVIKVAKKVALGNPSILIVGETGTGKELLAQSIHNAGPTMAMPFIAVNCGAIPETLLESIFFGTVKGAYTGAENKAGLFEEAQNGTLFLDELNSMSLMLQSKLLRVLENHTVRRLGDTKERPVNARIISAINTDPVDVIESGALRQDLFYRLSTVTLELPPLRERKEDIFLLTDTIIKKNNALLGKNVEEISEEVRGIFKAYQWPGNIRELKHVVEHSMYMVEAVDSKISLLHLPCEFHSRKIEDVLFENNKTTDLPKTIMAVEKKLISKAIENNNGNISQAAKELNISRQNLFYRMKRLKEG